LENILINNAYFISISSDIAGYIAQKLQAKGVTVHGTYRTENETTQILQENGAVLKRLDCSSKEEIENFLLSGFSLKSWDLLMVSPATMKPIARFDKCKWNEWESSFKLNCLRQFQIVHGLLKYQSRSSELDPLLFLWSGPGTNNAPLYYSAEITAKIAQIKFCELLDVEFSDLRTVIVGPGWVNTKVHNETIEAGESAESNYSRTKEIIQSDQVTSLENIYKFLLWTLDQSKSIISGRNFSIRGDIWGDEDLSKHLQTEINAFKLRRYSNDWRSFPHSESNLFSPK
jgi:NADP-dependent 3-hydroxy acid dehydrogenase YdfG